MDYLQIIQKSLDILLKNLEPLIHSIFSQIYGNEYLLYMNYGPRATNLTILEMKDNAIEMNNFSSTRKYKDILFYLNAIIKNWEIFKGMLESNYVLSLCHSIKHFRNKWAHQSQFTKRELHRFIDECQVLLEEFKLKSPELDLIRKSVLEIYYQDEITNNKSSIEENYKQSEKFLENANIQPSNFNSYSINNENSINNTNKHTKVETKYNQFNNYNYYADDHEMSEAYEELTESLLDQNYKKVITDKDRVYNEYNIYFYDAEKEDRRGNFIN